MSFGDLRGMTSGELNALAAMLRGNAARPLQTESDDYIRGLLNAQQAAVQADVWRPLNRSEAEHQRACRQEIEELRRWIEDLQRRNAALKKAAEKPEQTRLEPRVERAIEWARRQLLIAIDQNPDQVEEFTIYGEDGDGVIRALVRRLLADRPAGKKPPPAPQPKPELTRPLWAGAAAAAWGVVDWSVRILALAGAGAVAWWIIR